MELARAVHELQQALVTCQAGLRTGPSHATELAKQLPDLQAAAFQDRFVQAYLQDALNALQENLRHKPADDVRQQQLVHVILKRLEHLTNWDDRGNETIQAIRVGQVAAQDIKPFVRHPAPFYEAAYAAKNEKCRRFMAENMPRILRNNKNNKYQWVVPLIHAGAKGSTQHWVRKKQVISTMESILPLMQMVLPESAWVWIDVGCGAGRLVNAVNMGQGDLPRWRIIGCDLQADRIKKARLMAAKNREYHTLRIEQLVAEQSPFGVTSPGVVSMFEFIEHLEDPLKFLIGLRDIGVQGIVIGTPLAQKLHCPDDCEPDPIHLWGFNRQAVERFFALAGLDVVMSSETRVGSYLKGLDWLTVFGVLPQIKRSIQLKAKS